MSREEKKTLIDFTIRHAWHRISRMYNQKAVIHGITMSYGFILMTVEKEGTPSTKLGPMMGMEPMGSAAPGGSSITGGAVNPGSSSTGGRLQTRFK